MIYYSKITKGFYSTEIHGTNIPSDCVEISPETHQRLLEEQSQGKQIAPDERGYPIAITPTAPPITWEQIRSQRDLLLKETDWAALPDVNVSTKQSWLVYRQILRNIPQKFKTPEEVVWPEKPNN
jgi:hypothetical protein